MFELIEDSIPEMRVGEIFGQLDIAFGRLLAVTLHATAVEKRLDALQEGGFGIGESELTEWDKQDG